MSNSFIEVHKEFKYNGQSYNTEELKIKALDLKKSKNIFEYKTGQFLTDWLNQDYFIFAETSGSTGTPKRIKLKKQAMVNSALATGAYFDLKPSNTALNCLSSDYIAGKMMLVRAMVLGLHMDSVIPHSKVFFDTNKTYDFCAMVPIQVAGSIKKLDNVKTVIVGGSKIVPFLLDWIKTSPIKFYETYGMTETVTHVALKPLQSLVQDGEDFFKALPTISFSQDKRDCLIIDAPNLMEVPLVTNDVVELKSNKEFKWLGRFDNVINSGGVKLFPEQIEQKLLPIIKKRIIVCSEPDDKFGEKVILIIETSKDISSELHSKIQESKSLHKYERPKKIYAINQFVLTSNGKVQRQKTIDLVLG
ncbi:O-succinylbenzoic acid--CoA ligase [Winogradskyella sp. PC-19]|uniref:AMP-binding protein n=1 Tax=unclassified Winogradskyella TaxID=2615021 RepID=UPI000B3C3FD7|nr:MULTISPECIES: AMP-binding protein [unclassified Winogradskyella]ARV08767.1 O-succinylbenzoic acid--CoA ligase [Winogradskyella sp. PC-19]RZN75551.1 MAG: O-succinylbenzoic acid--CoA ligase [Winogradskyella sp.]